MCSTFKQRPIRPPLAGIVAVALLLLAAPLAAQDSNDATLSALMLEDGDPTTVTLSPTFDPEITSYTAKVAHDVAFITVTATRSDLEGAAFLILPSDSKETKLGIRSPSVSGQTRSRLGSRPPPEALPRKPTPSP